MDNLQSDIERSAENLLQGARLVGWGIVKCDRQRCATCTSESFNCKKLTMPGGQVCLWE